jgi:hypothetical protein
MIHDRKLCCHNRDIVHSSEWIKSKFPCIMHDVLSLSLTIYFISVCHFILEIYLTRKAQKFDQALIEVLMDCPKAISQNSLGSSKLMLSLPAYLSLFNEMFLNVIYEGVWHSIVRIKSVLSQ